MIKVPLWIRDLLKRDGSRTLTSDWDIGNGYMIKADKIRARDSDGLALYEDGSKGIFVKDGGNVGLGTITPEVDLHILKGGTQVTPSAYTALAIQDSTATDTHVRIQLIAGTGAQAVLNFGDTDDADIGGIIYDNSVDALTFRTNNVQDTRLFINALGNIGIGTSSPANPFAVNRSADGIIVDFESADVVEGNVSIADNTTSYNAFMGSHYTQLKDGQATPPIGAIVIATGEIIHCESNIEVPVMERYYKDEIEVPVGEGIKDDFIEVEIDTGLKQTAYVLLAGKVIKTEIPILKTIQKLRGKKLKEDCRLDKETGKIYKKIDKILKENEAPPENVTVLERQKTKGGKHVTEIKEKEVSGIKRKEYFSYIELASQKADKRVYGVYHAKLSDDAKGQSFGEDDKAVHQIAALGLYKVRVTDTNGDIDAGNYIQSSIRLGEGEKQDDDVLHSYTVAKAIINVNFSEVKMDLELGYKWQLIPVTLHCG